MAELLGRGSFDRKRILDMEPEFSTGEDDHEHDDDITSVSLTLDRTLDGDRFRAWIGTVLGAQGQDRLRTKGILEMQGDAERFAFQAVHMRAAGEFIGPWKAREARHSRLVFIGSNLNWPELRRGFEACVAA